MGHSRGWLGRMGAGLAICAVIFAGSAGRAASGRAASREIVARGMNGTAGIRCGEE
jgi:hypothetical protein